MMAKIICTKFQIFPLSCMYNLIQMDCHSDFIIPPLMQELRVVYIPKQGPCDSLMIFTKGYLGHHFSKGGHSGSGHFLFFLVCMIYFQN